MNAEIKSGENFLDEATKWVYADEKGVQVFALYGIGDGTEATPLYAVGGKQAVKEAKNINVYMEGSNNDGSTVDFKRWLEVHQHSRMGQGGSVLQSGRGGRNGDENGRIHSGQHERNAGGAAERSSENQRGVKDQFSLRDPVESYQGAETRSEGGETQYMARGRYWRPKLKRAEWELLEWRMNDEIKSGENLLDEATKWVYADEKGVQVFALYGIGDGTEATPLYAVGGEKAAAYNAAMTEFTERSQKYDGDGRSVDPLSELPWRKEGSRSGNLSQTSRKAGDAEGVSELHGGSQRSDSGGASGRSSENQRGVKDQFLLREPVEETRDLLALHNMTAANLRGALKPVRQPKEFSKFGNGALQQLASEAGVQELARINAQRQERLAVLDNVHSG